MDRWLDPERRLWRLACPECGSAGRLKTAVRCELASGERRYTVCCQHCGIIFELSTERPGAGPPPPGLQAWLAGLVCPACRAVGGEALFRGEVPSRAGFYLVRCASCRHEYAEERSPGARG
jgi:transcription elongation factor Elf1